MGGSQATAMQSLLGRLHRTGYRDGSPAGETATIFLPKTGALPRWGDTLPQSLLNGQIFRYFGNTAAFPTLIHDLDPPISTTCGEVLEEMDIHYVTEVMPDGQSFPPWLHPRQAPHLTAGLRALRASPVWETARNIHQPPGCPIAPGQFYTFIGDNYKRHYFEVDGVLDNTHIAGRWWCRQGNSLSLVPLEIHLKFGAAHTGIWDTSVFPLDTSRRTITYRPEGNHASPRILGTHADLAAILPVTVPVIAPWVSQILEQDWFDPYSIVMAVSDASYKRTQCQLHSIFSLQEATPTHAGGSFVLFESGSFRPVLGVQLQGMEELDDYNAFIGEIYAGVAMSQLRAQLPNPVEARLDCNSVVEGSGEGLPSSSQYYRNLYEDYGPLLNQFSRLRRNTPHPPIQWTRGHPDRSQKKKDGSTVPAIPRAEWGQAEYGIYIADHLADFDASVEQTLASEGLLPEHIVQIHVKDVLRALPSSGQWFRCHVNEPDIPIFRPHHIQLDEEHFGRYCKERERMSHRGARWSSLHLGLLKPTLKLLNATSWPSKWAKYMRIILDKLPHGRNIAKGQGPDAPIPTCPLCDLESDSLEHLTVCSHPQIASSRNSLFQAIHRELIQYVPAHDLDPATLIYARAYAFACASTQLPAIDILGGWTGIPVTRFLYFYGPNVPISDKVASGLAILIPKIMGECLLWLENIWRLRCRLVHTQPSGTLVSSSNGTPETELLGNPLSRLRTFHRRSDRPNVPSPMEDTLTPSDNSWFGLSPSDTDTQSRTSEATFFFDSQPDCLVSSELSLSSPSRVEVDLNDIANVAPPQMQYTATPELPLPTLLAAPSAEPSAPIIRSAVRSRLRAPIWSLGTRTQDLLYDLSEEWATPLASRCADLPGSGAFDRIPCTEYYFLPLPTQGYLGPSTISGAGFGLFIETSSMFVRSGMVMGEYWGPSTANRGISPSYCDPDPDLADPPNAREDGAYLLRHGTYLVDAHPDCAVGYLNDPFENANCFFQPDPDNSNRLLVVARVNFPSNGVFELTVNYGWQYWSERLHLLSADAQRRCVNFYLGRDGS